VVVPDDHGEAAAGLAVGEPERAHARGLERRHDLVPHVRDPRVEVGLGLVLEGDHLRVHRFSSPLTRGECHGSFVPRAASRYRPRMAETYTSGTWIVKPGEEDDFVAAWEAMAAWAAEMPGAGTFLLVRDTANAGHFMSFGAW